MTEMVEIFSNVGFPIAVCIALFYQNTKINDNYREMLMAMNNTIENNTLALKELAIKLDGGRSSENG